MRPPICDKTVPPIWKILDPPLICVDETDQSELNKMLAKHYLLVSGLSLALVHKHVKMSVGKWIMETTCPHKHVQILEDQIFLGLILFAMIISN